MTTGSRRVPTPRALRCSAIHRPSRAGLAIAPRSWRSACAALMCGVLAVAGLLVAPRAHAVYAIAQYGEPKYPADFKHFDYVNPDAPKGGTLVLANPNRLTSFDKFNPFTLRGNTAPGVGPDVRKPDDRQQRRSGVRLRAARRRHQHRAGWTVGDLPHQSARALFERRSGHRRRRQVLVRHAEKPAGRAAIRLDLRRDHARGGDRSAHDPLRVSVSAIASCRCSRAAYRCSRASGG